ncbi:MAG TPA: hypothetical protein VIM39_14940 [Candidatus Limnocylindrales bacterium]
MVSRAVVNHGLGPTVLDRLVDDRAADARKPASDDREAQSPGWLVRLHESTLNHCARAKDLDDQSVGPLSAGRSDEPVINERTVRAIVDLAREMLVSVCDAVGNGRCLVAEERVLSLGDDDRKGTKRATELD